MYIDTIRLENIRGFRELEFSFDRGQGQYAGWTVLTGDNGSGKSTVLKAMALVLAENIRAALQPSFRGWVRSGAGDGRIELHAIAHGSTGHRAHIEIVEHPARVGGVLMPDAMGVFDSHPIDGFSCGYGPFRRISRAAPDMSDLMTAPVIERFVTLFQETASLVEVDRWLRNLNYKRLEQKPEAEATLAIVLELLNNDFLPNQITVDRVDSDGLWLKDREGNALSWADMSDGYRAALALLADILRHMVNACGTDDLTGRDDEGRLFLKPAGVVLIDEIDAHLHPEWQREIGFWLKRHFPNIQFIVTSHSPLICQAADPNGLFVLPEPGSDEPARALTAEEYQEVISSRPDTILRSAAFGLQNTRSPVAVEARSAFADLRTKQRAGGKLTQAEQVELERLRQYINPDEEP
ncbi:AAA family ATPase [Sphaerotilus sulfidivorans]